MRGLDGMHDLGFALPTALTNVVGTLFGTAVGAGKDYLAAQQAKELAKTNAEIARQQAAQAQAAQIAAAVQSEAAAQAAYNRNIKLAIGVGGVVLLGIAGYVAYKAVAGRRK